MDYEGEEYNEFWKSDKLHIFHFSCGTLTEKLKF